MLDATIPSMKFKISVISGYLPNSCMHIMFYILGVVQAEIFTTRAKGFLLFYESWPCRLEYHGGKIKFEYLIVKIQI